MIFSLTFPSLFLSLLSYFLFLAHREVSQRSEKGSTGIIVVFVWENLCLYTRVWKTGEEDHSGRLRLDVALPIDGEKIDTWGKGKHTALKLMLSVMLRSNLMGHNLLFARPKTHIP